MKPLPVLLLALGAGLFGAFLYDFLSLRSASDVLLAPTPDPVGATERVLPSPLQTGSGPGDDSLRDELDDLRERIEELERGGLTAERSPAGGAASQLELEALRQELQAGVPPQAKLESQIAETLKTIRKDEAVTKVKAAHQKSVARFEDRMTELNEWLDLAPHQQTEMRSLIANKDTLDTELIAMWERGVDDEVLEEIKQTNEDQFNAAFMLVLTPDQQQIVYDTFGGGKDQATDSAK